MDHITIEENQEQNIKVSSDFLTYLRNFPGEDKRKNKRELVNIKRYSEDVCIVRPGSFVGVVDFQGTRMDFRPKVETNIYNMLAFLSDDDSFHYDDTTVIDVDGGECFFDALAQIFFNYLEEVLKKGLLKRYVTKEENLRFKKGKIQFQQNLRHNLDLKPNFYCRYNDLTCNNLENQVVLRALDLLIHRIKYRDDLKFELLRCEKMMLEEVALDPGISHVDCGSIPMDRLNQRYTDILAFSRLVLMNHFIRSTEKNRAKGFNFLVDMNKLYESFVTEMVRQVVSERYPGYRVEAQEAFRTLDDGGKIASRPDIIVKGPNNEFPIIIDAKYKGSVATSDEYQMIAYLLAIKTSRVACLLYPTQADVKDDDLKIKRNMTDEGSERVVLSIRSINLNDNGRRYHEYIGATKDQIQGMIKSLFDSESN